MNNHMDKSASADPTPKGSPEAVVLLDQLKVETVETPPIQKIPSEKRLGKTKRSMSRMEDATCEEKTFGRLRTTSYTCEVKRSGLINAQFASNDTVCVWNDQTGQSVVVASNESTRDALASLCQRDSEVERMEAAARISWKRAEDRTIEERETLRMYQEEYANSRHQQNRTRTQSLSTQSKRNSRRSQSFIDPTNMTAEEAQAMFFTYLNYTQQDIGKFNSIFRPDQKQMQPFLNKLQSSSVPLHRLPRETIMKQNIATATALVMETTTLVMPASVLDSDAQNRSHFGISRFLGNTENNTMPSSLSSVNRSVRQSNDLEPSVASNESESDSAHYSRNSDDESSVNPMAVPTVREVQTAVTPVLNDVSPPSACLENTSRAVVFNVDCPINIEQSQVQQEPVRQINIERNRNSPTSPIQRSKSTPASEATDEDLIAFLREPLALARAAEQEALRKKAMEPKPKRKSRAKTAAKRAEPPCADPQNTVDSDRKSISHQSRSKKNSRSKSTPSNFPIESSSTESSEPMQQNILQKSELNISSPDHLPGTGQPSVRSFIRLDMPLGQALQEVPLGAVAGQLRVQKALYEQMDGINGFLPEAATSGGQVISGESTTLAEEKVAPNLKNLTNTDIETTVGDQHIKKPKKKRAPPRKKELIVTHEEPMVSMDAHIQRQTVFHQPAQHSHHQPLPSVANLLPPLNTYQQQHHLPQLQHQHHNGVTNNNMLNGYSHSESNGGSSSSSSSVYSSYSYSMQSAPDQPKKHQSLASMLEPLTCSSTTAQKEGTSSSHVFSENYQQYNQQQTTNVVNEDSLYPQHAAIYSNQSSVNGYYTGFDGTQTTQYHQSEYPPLSVESHISCNSQESNPPQSHHSSMPQTPISHQVNNGSLYNSMPVSHDSQFSNSNGHIHPEPARQEFSIEEFAQKYGIETRNTSAANDKPVSPTRAGMFHYLNYEGLTQKQVEEYLDSLDEKEKKRLRALGIHDAASYIAHANSLSLDDDLTVYLESRSLTGNDERELFIEGGIPAPPNNAAQQHAEQSVQGNVPPNRVMKTSMGEGQSQSYANVQYVLKNPSLPVPSQNDCAPDSAAYRSSKTPQSVLSTIEGMQSNQPGSQNNTNRCVNEINNTVNQKPVPHVSVNTAAVVVSKPRYKKKSVEQQPQQQSAELQLKPKRLGENMLKPDDQQICYVQYLPHEISHTNLGRQAHSSKFNDAVDNGQSSVVLNQGPPPLLTKKARPKLRKKQQEAPSLLQTDVSNSGLVYPEHNPAEVPIGKLLKQQHMMMTSPGERRQINRIACPQTLQQPMMLSPIMHKIIDQEQGVQHLLEHNYVEQPEMEQKFEEKPQMESCYVELSKVEDQFQTRMQIKQHHEDKPLKEGQYAGQSTVEHTQIVQQPVQQQSGQHVIEKNMQRTVEELPDVFPDNFLEPSPPPDKVTETINDVLASVLSSPEDINGTKRLTETEKHLLEGPKVTPKKHIYVERKGRVGNQHQASSISNQTSMQSQHVHQHQLQPQQIQLQPHARQHQMQLASNETHSPQHSHDSYQRVQQIPVIQNDVQMQGMQPEPSHNKLNGVQQIKRQRRKPQKSASAQSRSVTLREKAQMIVDYAKSQPLLQQKEDQDLQHSLESQVPQQQSQSNFQVQQQLQLQNEQPSNRSSAPRQFQQQSHIKHPLLQQQLQRPSQSQMQIHQQIQVQNGQPQNQRQFSQQSVLQNKQQQQVQNHQHAQVQQLTQNQQQQPQTQYRQQSQLQNQQQLLVQNHQQQPPQGLHPQPQQRNTQNTQQDQTQQSQHLMQQQHARQQQPMMQRLQHQQFVQQQESLPTVTTPILVMSTNAPAHSRTAQKPKTQPIDTQLKDEAIILRILKDKLSTDDETIAPKMSPVLRVKHMRETINRIASMPSLTPEQVFEIGNSPPPDGYMDDYIVFFNKITQLMKDDPCLPEIGVEDVLSIPMLEPALHGRFRKRLAAIREGRTTVTTFKKRKAHPALSVDAKKCKLSSGDDPSCIVRLSGSSIDQEVLFGQSSEVKSLPLSVVTGTGSLCPSPPMTNIETSNRFITPPHDVSLSQTPLTTPPLDIQFEHQVSGPSASQNMTLALSTPSTSSASPSSKASNDQIAQPHNYFEDFLDNGSISPILFNDPIMGYVEEEKFGNMNMDEIINEVMKTDATEELLVHNQQRTVFDPSKFNEENVILTMDSNNDNHRPTTPSVGILDDLNTVDASFYLNVSPYPSLELHVDFSLQSCTGDRYVSTDCIDSNQLSVISPPFINPVVFNDSADDSIAIAGEHITSVDMNADQPNCDHFNTRSSKSELQYSEQSQET